MAAPANHEYPTVTGTVVDIVWVMWVLLSIGIAWGVLLAGQKVGWQCLLLLHLQCRGTIASVPGGCGAFPELRGSH